MDRSYDVAVVGAGIVGLAHALAAARRGKRVVVIDRDAACVGASVRNFGFITVTGQAAGDSWRRALHSREVWADLAPQAGIDIVQRELWLAAFRPEAHAVLEAFLRTPMGEGCQLVEAAEAQQRSPALRLDEAISVLHSPHELRVESRTAIGLLTRWLAESLGVVFRFGEAVLEVATPHVCTARATLHAERVVVCCNTELNGLFADRIAAHAPSLCRLQMLRVRPEPGFRLPGAVMMDLSLVRYAGYSALPEAAALKERLLQEEPASLAHGIHLIAVQSADGTLVVGDSHRYGAAPEPFALEEVDQLILRHLRSTLNLEQAQIVERWTGTYPWSAATPCVVDAPDAATRVVLVTGGTGASTAFGIAHDVFEAW